MKGTILERIIDAKRVRLEAAKRVTDEATTTSKANSKRPARRFRDALLDGSQLNIIGEFKRASPSKGVINDSLDPAIVAKQYELGGAKAISVLTEEDFFKGSLDDLRNVRASTELPILRKDFIIDEYQIFESAAAGADAILLIVAALDTETLQRFQTLANGLGLDAIIEVHDLAELETAISVNAKIIGVNNRNLKTFDVSLDVSRALIKHAPKDVVMIAESGISNRNEITELYGLGYSGFLIGESLMRSDNAASLLGEWV